ncbi:MAG: type II toxin-antitoxin system HicA family toxin [Elusimicrobia bacterium]|nr:type II toxin-antitoxin system HicA family toxin [Elusimicrobiota bacterium]
MPDLPQIKPSRLIRALEKLGFAVARQKGSHAQLRKGILLVTVPVHSGDLNPETLRSVLRQARMTADELRRAL